MKVMSKLSGILVLGCVFLGVVACQNGTDGTKKKYIKAKVLLKPTKGNEVTGEVTFVETDKGVHVVADVDGLKQGKHGFHIHENGDCSAPDGSSAGGHFNPKKALHGGPESAERHVGDLGNVVADDKGHGHYERDDFVITLKGENSIIGRSVVVHSDADDFKTQPTGNSGGRLACGIIEEVK